MKYSKKNKIVDCFFFYDEIEMLKFRFTELDEYVDYFIVIEGKIDYRNAPKKINFDINDESFKNWKHKIIHIVYNSFEKKELKLIYEKLNYFMKIMSFNEFVTTKNDIIDFALNELREKILTIDLSFEDLILVSDVDEIPDLKDSEVFLEYIKSQTIILVQKNFVWTTDFIDQYPHLGTCVFNKSNFLTNPTLLFSNFEKKSEMRDSIAMKINNGYHLSHFYDYNRALKKLNLLHEDSNNVTLTKSKILESMKNLTHPSQINKPILKTLTEYRDVLPKNINLLKNQSVGRMWSKNFLVLVNPSEETKLNKFVTDYHQPFFINFTKEYIKRENLQNEYDIFSPSEIYYLYKDHTTLDKFKYIYCLNEINKVIGRHLLLSHDFIIVSLENYVPSSEEIKNNLKKSESYFDHEKKYAILKWEILRDSIISDIISEIL